MDITNVDALAEVHHLILSEIGNIVPAKMLRLNKTYLDKLLPSIYETVALNENNVNGFLYGLADGFEVIDGVLKEKKGIYKVTALRYVKNFRFDHWIAGTEFWLVHQQLCQMVDGVDDDGKNENTTRAKIPMLLPGVTHLHYGKAWVGQIVPYCQNPNDEPVREIRIRYLVIEKHISPRTLTIDMVDFGWWDRHQYQYERQVSYRIEVLFTAPRFPENITVNTKITSPFMSRIDFDEATSETSTGIYFIRFTDSCVDVEPDDMERLAKGIWDHYEKTLHLANHYKPTYLIRERKFLIEQLRKLRSGPWRAWITEDDMVQVERMILEDTEINSTCPCVETSRTMQ